MKLNTNSSLGFSVLLFVMCLFSMAHAFQSRSPGLLGSFYTIYSTHTSQELKQLRDKLKEDEQRIGEMQNEINALKFQLEELTRQY